MGSLLSMSTPIPMSGMVRTRFSAMGTNGEIIVRAPDLGEVAAVIERVEQLERRWSRFLPDSEVSLLNAANGVPHEVSDDTLLLVEVANASWHLTGGLFDSLLLHPLRLAGYDDDFELLPTDRPAPTVPYAEAAPRRVRPLVDRDTRTVTLPHGAGFDPGGIGKGLAADLGGDQLIRRGVSAGVINLGGDLRLWGEGPHDGDWHVGLPDRTVAMTDAGVATSGTTRRHWNVAGRRLHHLIDPATAEPCAGETVSVTVVAATAWLADVIAVAASITPVAAVPDWLSRLGVEGVAVGSNGETVATPRMCAR